MTNDTTNKVRKHGRGILTPEQSKQLIEHIRKIQIGTEGLTKKFVVEQAFSESFGPNIAEWPIQPHSSTIARYWRLAFPSEKVNIGKKRSRSPQPLLDDLRRKEPQIPMVPLECVFHDCPWCHKPVRALVVAAATVMKHEQDH